MATEGNGGLGLSEEVREGQLMDPALDRVADGRMEDSTQNTLPWLEAFIRGIVREEFEHLMKSGPAMVGGSVADGRMEDSTQNTPPWLEAFIRGIVREEFEHLMKSGPEMVGGRAPVYERQKQKCVLKAKTDAFEVKHYKKKSKEKHVTPALDDDVRTLCGIGYEYEKMLKENGIYTVQDFLRKLGLDRKGLWMILKKTRKWDSIVAHAKKSVPSGKYYSAETLSDSQKVCADNLKREACAKWKYIEEYDGLPPLETNPSKKARLSQTDVVNCAPESRPSSSYAGPPMKPGLDVGGPVPCQPPSVPSGEAYENSMWDFEVDYLLDSPSLSPDRSQKADGNTKLSVGSLNAFWREVDRSDSHSPGSSLDPPEQAGGNIVLYVGAHGGSFERGEGSKSPWIEEEIYNQEAGNYQYQRNM